jgi:hypothetical protein
MFFLEKTRANVSKMITYGGMEVCFRSCKYFYQRKNPAWGVHEAQPSRVHWVCLLKYLLR